MFTRHNILQRAVEILKKGPLPESHNEHGEWCPYCAIALANTQLCIENNCGISDLQCIHEIITGFTEQPEDKPLLEAKEILNQKTFIKPFERNDVINYIQTNT